MPAWTMQQFHISLSASQDRSEMAGEAAMLDEGSSASCKGC